VDTATVVDQSATAWYAIIAEATIVEVVDGPLRGVVGRLLQKDARSATVVLSVSLIQQAVKVEVDAAGIRPQLG
jgi:transcription antitermination factor NusG